MLYIRLGSRPTQDNSFVRYAGQVGGSGRLVWYSGQVGCSGNQVRLTGQVSLSGKRLGRLLDRLANQRPELRQVGAATASFSHGGYHAESCFLYA